MEDNELQITDRKDFLDKIKVQRTITPQTAKELIDKPLTNVEAFYLVENDKDKVQIYALFDKLKEKAEKGELTKKELEFLCDTAFGKDSLEAKKVYNEIIKSGKIRLNSDEKEK